MIYTIKEIPCGSFSEIDYPCAFRSLDEAVECARDMYDERPSFVYIIDGNNDWYDYNGNKLIESEV